MSEEQDVSPLHREMIEAMAGLHLAPMQTSLQDVWYRAGFESGRRRTHFWRAAAAIAFVGCGALSWGLASKPPAAQQIVYVKQQITHSPTPVSIAAASSTGQSSNYDRLCERVAMLGLDGLPPDRNWNDSSESGRPNVPDPSFNEWQLHVHGG